jgi:putative ABC transport system permease protein
VKAALAVVDLLISLLPTAFRKSFGHEIRADFVDHWGDCTQSRRGVRRTLQLTGFLVSAYGNLLFINITERFKSSASPHHKRRKMKAIRGDQRTTVSTLRRQPDSLLQDVRYAVRGLVRQPGFTASVVLLLAIGIGANVAMFSALHQALLRPLPFAEPENLVLGRTTFSGNLNPDMSAYDYFDYRERNEVFESVGAIRTGSKFATVTGGEEPERINTLVVSWDLFPTLGVPTVAGRYFTPAEGELGGPNVVMISGGYWMRRFGGAHDAVGSRLSVGGTVQTIVGVMPPGFEFLHDVDLWLPMRRGDPTTNADSRGWHNWLMVGRLKPGITFETARADLDVIAAQLASEYPESNKTKEILLTKLQEAFAENYQTTVVLLMAAVGLVLLIACGNVASLLLARGATRRSELCVRAALGASPARLVRQLITESMVTAIMGGALGVTFAMYFQKLVLHVVPADVPGMESLGMSWPMLAFALAASVATGLLFGVLPAVQAARARIAGDVRSGARTTDSRGQRFQSCLVVTQVAVSVVLLIGSGLLLKSFATLRSVEPGFDTANLITAEIQIASNKYPDEPGRTQFFTELLEDLRAIPGVADVAVISQLPIRNPGNNPFAYAADKPLPDHSERRGAYWRTVLPGYFDAMGIPLLRGRGIDASDIEGVPPALVINETMARRLFPDEDPLGKRVGIFRRDAFYEVVGVVGDVRMSGTRYTPRMAMYAPYAQHPTLTMRIAIRSAIEPTWLAPAVRDVVWNLDRDIPVTGLLSMDEIVTRTVANDKVVALAVTMFAAVAVVLAALGLYGVLAYYVNRRHHEIGIQVALGAGAGQVIRPILRRGLALVAAGIGLGLVGAFWSARVLQRLLFDVAPTDTATFVFVSLFFAAVALVACLLPAMRALKVDPVTALAAQ